MLTLGERVYNAVVRFDHWDVNNEQLHGNFFEAKTGDINITAKMFTQMHRQDPATQLFLNDYSLVSSSTLTKVTPDVSHLVYKYDMVAVFITPC